MSLPIESEKSSAGLNGRQPSLTTEVGTVTVLNLKDADEALEFLSNHPRALEIAEEGNAILEDPIQLKKLIRKIDLTIAPLLAAVYFLQFLDKTTLSYTAVMGIRTDTHLEGQLPRIIPTSLCCSTLVSWQPNSQHSISRNTHHD